MERLFEFFFLFLIFREWFQPVTLKEQLETDQYYHQEPRKAGLCWPMYMLVHMCAHTHRV